MAVYLWKARTRQGTVKKGELEATNQEAALTQLRAQMLMPISVKVKPKDITEYLPFLKPGITTRELVIFTRQFSAPTSRARVAARRIAEYELYIGLVKARLITQAGGPRRLPWAKEKDLITTGAALAEKYLKAAELLGIDARVKDLLDPFRAEMLRQEMEAECEERERQRADAAEVQDGPPERPGGSQVDDLGNRAMHIPVDCDDGDGDQRVES